MTARRMTALCCTVNERHQNKNTKFERTKAKCPRVKKKEIKLKNKNEKSTPAKSFYDKICFVALVSIYKIYILKSFFALSSSSYIYLADRRVFIMLSDMCSLPGFASLCALLLLRINILSFTAFNHISNTFCFVLFFLCCQHLLYLHWCTEIRRDT